MEDSLFCQSQIELSAFHRWHIKPTIYNHSVFSPNLTVFPPARHEKNRNAGKGCEEWCLPCLDTAQSLTGSCEQHDCRACRDSGQTARSPWTPSRAFTTLSEKAGCQRVCGPLHEQASPTGKAPVEHVPLPRFATRAARQTSARLDNLTRLPGSPGDGTGAVLPRH